METAPKDRPILGLCVHEADEYHYEYDGKTFLTDYACHVESMSRVEDGPHVIVWGGGSWESTDEYGSGFAIPDWWFQSGTSFEIVANPVLWCEIPKIPDLEQFKKFPEIG